MTSNRGDWEQALKGLPKTHINVGISNLANSNKQVASLWKHGKCPDEGWSDVWITRLLWELSELDTSNKSGRWCGVGEREGRVYSSLVQMRHYGLSHGMGRSGDIQEAQPKAVGSTALVQLTCSLVKDVMIRGAGLTCAQHVSVLPLCTGMTTSLVLQAASSSGEKKIILWSRIDQKSCFKAIAIAGYTCVVVPTIIDEETGGGVTMDLAAFQHLIEVEYKDQVACVLTTTSCFAPRIPDPVDKVATLCKGYDIPLVINHAYGLQCIQTNKLLNRACTIGRVDAIVLSTDKNFLVPVGGAIVASPHKSIIERIGKSYAGRASSTPIVDLFITLLSMGLNGYKDLHQLRLSMKDEFQQKLQQIATKYQETLIPTYSKNTISFAITLNQLKNPMLLGSKLFVRCVSGTRVVVPATSKNMNHNNIVLEGFGSSHDNYPHSYLTAACAIGLTQDEMNQFFQRLDKTLKEFHAKQNKENNVS